MTPDISECLVLTWQTLTWVKIYKILNISILIKGRIYAEVWALCNPCVIRTYSVSFIHNIYTHCVCVIKFLSPFSTRFTAAILVLYLTYYLGFNENTSTALYHTFIVLCYATPLLGAIIADSLLGKFKLVDMYLTVKYFKQKCIPYHIWEITDE